MNPRGGQPAQFQLVHEVLRDLGVKLVPVQSTALLKDFGLTHELIVGMVTMESAASFAELTRQGEGAESDPSHVAGCEGHTRQRACR